MPTKKIFGHINYNSKESLTILINGETYIIKAWIRYWTIGWLGIYIQSFLYRRKIYWHNWLSGECTPGFECCMHKIKTEKDKAIMRGLLNMRSMNIPVAGFKKDGTNDVLDRFMEKSKNDSPGN